MAGIVRPWILEHRDGLRAETKVFSFADNKLVWSGLSKTVDPNTISSAIDDVTKVVAQALEKQHIVESAGGVAAPA